MNKVVETFYAKWCSTNTEAAMEYFDTEVFNSEDTKFWDSETTIIVTEVICGQLHRIEVLQE